MNIETKNMNETAKKQTIDVIIPSSDKYMKYVSVLMISAMENLKDDYRLFFHIVTEDIQEETKRKVNFLKFKYDFDIEYKYINDEFISIFPMCTNKYIDSKIVYAKLLFSSLFPDMDKAIILEGDMIVTGDLSELWGIDLKDNYIAAVKDMWYKDKDDYAGMFYQKGYYYVNTGFFYTELSKWRDINFENIVKEKMPEVELKWPDQDLFNVIFKGKILYLDNGWNFGPCVDRISSYLLSSDEKQEIKKSEKKIIHYMLKDKAWTNFTGSYNEYFWYYARKSPYYEIMLQDMFAGRYELKEVINYNTSEMKYRFYKIMSKITVGKAKERYKSKISKWKNKLNIVRRIKRGW